MAAYSTVAVTIGLVAARPRIGTAGRLNPALAAFGGVLALAALGAVRAGAVAAAAADLWRPFVAIAAIMIMADAAIAVGLLDWAAARIERGARTAPALLARVFALGAATATALNNDAAILLLTPLVVALARRRFPGRPELVVPLAFSVFLAAGVAALPVSNPMNMVVAEFADIGFNEYAAQMAPVACAVWLIGFAALRWWFRSQLVAVPAPGDRTPVRATRAQRRLAALLVGALGAYSVVAAAGGPVWTVALAGAAGALALSRRATGRSTVEAVARAVSWETLAFLACVVVLALGLQQVGLVDRLGAHYAQTGLAGVGVTSAVGSALLNNHPMAYMNMLALEASAHGHTGVLAALIGGDLGPRLLPMGSLAGLLWLDALRRQGVHVPLRTFVAVGAVATVPALAVGLALLAAM